MKRSILDAFREKGHSLSFEIYPPKRNHPRQVPLIQRTVDRLSVLQPDFISVTFGAGGSNRGLAVEMSEYVQSHGVPALAHITSVGFTRADVLRMLDRLQQVHVENVLAIRGDLPEGVSFPHGAWCEFQFAKELIGFIKENKAFCVGAAAYPEGNRNCRDVESTVQQMREKMEAGADFFITQLFFDNKAFFRFMDAVQRAGIHAPVIPGIMPILKAGQVRKILQLSGAALTVELERLLEKHAEDEQGMEQAGIDFASQQILELQQQGWHSFHLYSMNHSRQIRAIVQNVWGEER